MRISVSNLCPLARERSSAGHGLRLALLPILFLTFLLPMVTPRASADVGVVLNESLDESMDRITGTGHTAIYFSRICAETPTKLRLCGPGESGSVMSTYINIGEDHSVEWNIVPLDIYLYGVEDPRNRPIFASFKIKHALEERYRQNYLSAVCETPSCQTSNKAEWREMVAATLIRGMYFFVVDTSIEQDRQLVEELNNAPNKNHFNGATNNCADFARRIVNTYFPHAASRDVLNDFGMTSPKAVARTFTHYAQRHPELNLRVMHFAQVPGTIKRSSEVRAGTEQLLRSKKLLVPMAVFAYEALPVVAASYVSTGRFNPEKEFEQHPATNLSADSLTPASQLQTVTLQDDRTRIVGTPAEWKNYRKAFESEIEDDKDSPDARDRFHFFKHLDEKGTAALDPDGAAWMQLSEHGESVSVGVSAGNVLAAQSDPQLSHQLLLARVSTFLKSPKHRREPMLEFRQDWDNLQRASAGALAASATNNTPSATARATPFPAGGTF
ncbi:MAG TPA: hypothetical protein VFI45_05315 [Candidatus Acidoferrum sp.]|nr:hypothetical protein [Candidatus Acidoferrum sp.]